MTRQQGRAFKEGAQIGMLGWLDETGDILRYRSMMMPSVYILALMDEPVGLLCRAFK